MPTLFNKLLNLPTMNKTITIQLGGSFFHIEEEACTLLKNYLDAITANFQGDPAVNEILQDIELRIAELFQSYLNEQKNVVMLADVYAMMEVMGKPEDYGSAETSSGKYQSKAGEGRHRNRRIFRDKEDAVVAGVCSGLSHYFGWDPLVIRLLVVGLCLVSFGTALVGYIIFWALVPAAETTAEKLQMRGEAPTVENIARFVNQEAKDAAENLNKAGQRLRNDSSNSYSLVQSLGKIIKKLFGVFWIGVGIFLLIMLTLMIVASEYGTFAGVNWHELQTLVFPNDSNPWLITVGVALLLLAPGAAFLYWGLRMLMDNAKRVPGLSIGLFVLFLAGIGLSAAGGLQVAKEFKEDAELTATLSLDSLNTSTLYLEVEEDTLFKGRTRGRDYDTFELVKHTENKTHFGNLVHVTFEPTNDEHFSLRIIRKSCGASMNEATRLADAIECNYTVTDSILKVSPVLSIPGNNQYRGQVVDVQVNVPVGKYIHFGANTHALYWNHDYEGRFRRMSIDGWDHEFDEEWETLPGRTPPPSAVRRVSLLRY